MLNKDHPRYKSLLYREKIVKAHDAGILADSGMIAHGRGETFDYLIGEKTTPNAKNTIDIAACYFLVAKNPVISVNGNTTALVADEIAELSKLLDIPIEINLYYRTDERVLNISRVYEDLGITNLLGTNDDEFIDTPDLNGPRSPVSIDGINKADLIFIPLEDGDRAEKLTINNNKNTICVDLNPLSRTAQTSTVSIVDNIVRVIPELIDSIKKHENMSKDELNAKIESFSNEENLSNSIDDIIKRFK
ncbi:phosphopantothenate/pantothenate synthetase [Methanosphaera cuniculi]|uniref:phosphopantothenate/pantothenate synthetase n=1 Tax=Methanosphaera cuniculi TaxID=1077256 RepID=UPI0026EF6DCD|nr:phosphopantothenate/pantothenate synthetase [Methanosphaera cuniculi]